MSTTPPPTPRASLLSGLRTGGVRSSSISGFTPSAAQTSFNLPQQFDPNQKYNNSVFPEEEDQLPEMPNQNLFSHSLRQAPQTAAATQQRGMNPNSLPFNPSFSIQHAQQQQQQQHQQQQLQLQMQQQFQQQHLQQQTQQQRQQNHHNHHAQSQPNQHLQMQMMQLEILRLQAMQAQQYQTELLAQAQFQSNRRSSLQVNPPTSADPHQIGFDFHGASARAQARRISQADLKVKTELPLSASLNGKFGIRSSSLGTSALARYSSDDSGDEAGFSTPITPSGTTVISGGTSLGGVTPVATRSDADVAVSWRRGGVTPTATNGGIRSLSVKASGLNAGEKHAPSPIKAKPAALRFTTPEREAAIAIDSSTDSATDNEDTNSTSSKSGRSSPTTPRSSGSSNNENPSPREEASKKLYEGLGVGRPVNVPTVVVAPPAAAQPAPVAYYKVTSLPVRQPRGPPSGSEDLGPMNFASRIRRKAIGGLGMLMGARERREIVDIY